MSGAKLDTSAVILAATAKTKTTISIERLHLLVFPRNFWRYICAVSWRQPSTKDDLILARDIQEENTESMDGPAT